MFPSVLFPHWNKMKRSCLEITEAEVGVSLGVRKSQLTCFWCQKQTVLITLMLQRHLSDWYSTFGHRCRNGLKWENLPGRITRQYVTSKHPGALFGLKWTRGEHNVSDSTNIHLDVRVIDWTTHTRYHCWESCSLPYLTIQHVYTSDTHFSGHKWRSDASFDAEGNASGTVGY